LRLCYAQKAKAEQNAQYERLWFYRGGGVQWHAPALSGSSIGVIESHTVTVCLKAKYLMIAKTQWNFSNA